MWDDRVNQQIKAAKIEANRLSQLYDSATKYVKENTEFLKQVYKYDNMTKLIMPEQEMFNHIGTTTNYLKEFNNLYDFGLNSHNFIDSSLEYKTSYKALSSQYNQMVPHVNSWFSQIGVNSSLNALRINSPCFLNYEDNYIKGYHELYSALNPNWNKIFFSTDYPTNLEIQDTQKDKSFPLENVKDIVGIPQLFKDISQVEAANFLGHLEKYPFLALEHKVGKKIFKELKEQIEQHKKSIDQLILYRSRVWTEKQELPYSVNDMWNAPLGLPTMGRFNPAGVSYLYMSDSIETSKAEIKIDSDLKYNIMKSKLKSSITVLDFSNQTCPIFEFCNKKQESNRATPREYLIPNFIAQCISYLKSKNEPSVDGIKYKSTLNPQGYCYVFFGISEQDFIESEIIE